MNLKEYLIINNLSDINEKEFKEYALKKKKNIIEYFLEKKEGSVYSYYKKIVGVALVFSFVLGVFAGIGVLSYSGALEPVNVTYILFLTVFMPLVLGLFTIFSLFSSAYFAPFKWVERVVNLFSKNKLKIKIDSKVEKYLAIRNSLFMQLCFALGLFLGMFFILLIDNRVFAWKSTIISKELFSAFIDYISLPWRIFFPDVVISKDIIELSHFSYKNTNYSELWWKFILLSTLFYMIILRVILLIIVEFFYKRALQKAVAKSFMVQKIKNILQAPTITIDKTEKKNAINLAKQEKKTQLKETKTETKKQNVLAWNYQKDELDTLSSQIESDDISIVGGLQSFMQDLETIKKFQDKEVLLVIKSWDIPTLDFIDFLEELSKSAKKVVLYFDKLNQNSQKDIQIWLDKIESFEFENIEIFQEQQ